MKVIDGGEDGWDGSNDESNNDDNDDNDKDEDDDNNKDDNDNDKDKDNNDEDDKDNDRSMPVTVLADVYLAKMIGTSLCKTSQFSVLICPIT